MLSECSRIRSSDMDGFNVQYWSHQENKKLTVFSLITHFKINIHPREKTRVSRCLYINNTVCNIILCYVRQLFHLYLAGWHSPHFILATAGFSEVCDGGELGMDGLPVKPPVVQLNHGLLRVLFVAELQKGRQNIEGVSERCCVEHMNAGWDVGFKSRAAHFCEWM